MEKVTITLDGREVSGPKGVTVLELAQEAGINIPTLCHHSYLSPTGACRVCLVEEERSANLLVSCVTAIEPGMLINTQSSRVIERRKAIVELMLASHPDSCMVCDKGNRCELHRVASKLGIGVPSFDKIPQRATITDVNPFIVRDMSKCILCGRCVRADQELVVEGAIDFLGRGFGSRPSTVGGVPLEQSECSFCGTCVVTCPTGALAERGAMGVGTTSRVVTTTCPFCGCGCSIALEVKDGRIARARPGDGGPVNRGTLCVRGAYGYDFVHSTERLKTPLMRGTDGLEPVSWEEALETVSEGFRRIIREAGPQSLAVLGTPTGTNEENYLLQKFARCVLHTPNIDNGARLCGAATYAGLGGTAGYPGTVGTIDDIESAELILVIGAGLSASAPAVGYAVKRAVARKGARLILIDPRMTSLTRFAHLWLRQEPGTDVALLNGLASVIVSDGLLDKEFVGRKTVGFEELSRHLQRYSLEYVQQVTGVAAEDIRRAAHAYGSATRAVIIYGGGVTRSARGTDTVKALANLSLLTGNIERKGTGLYALQARNNAQGACDMGAMPELLPGYCSLADEPGRTKFERRWNLTLPTSAGLAAAEMMTEAAAGRVKAMYIVGENPVASFPDAASVEKALGRLELLVVQDIFLTDTAALATVVLPAASFAEKAGTFTNFEGRVQPVRKALPPLGESRPDWEIIMALADAMGSPLGLETLEDVQSEIEELVPFFQAAGGTERVGAPGVRDTAPWPGRRLYEQVFPSTFGRFSSVDYVPEEGRSEEYPLILVTGGQLFQFGTGSRTSRSPRLRRFAPDSYVEVSEVDAERLGIRDSEEVRVVSATGMVAAVARVTNAQPRGLLFAPSAFPDGRVNGLFPAILDSQSKTPALGHCAVRLERGHPYA
ncbi:MAG: formate dehydrogenase subunit alpha [Actinobacteria bacterium]|nr:formate dehydrogenase subunit alpha [Actinomycetota bacterium]